MPDWEPLNDNNRYCTTLIATEKMRKQTKSEHLFLLPQNWSLKLQSTGQIWPTQFFYKVLLEGSHTHLFIYCLWLLPQNKSRVEYLRQSSYGMQILNIYYLDIFSKHLLTSIIEQRCQYVKKFLFVSYMVQYQFFSRSNIQTYSVGFGSITTLANWALVCIEIS